ncbi:chemotaxis protein CheW [Calditrichota bacterium GD2]
METNVKNTLLKERARRLAQKAFLPEEIKDARAIVLFSLNNELYAVDVQQIRAIQPFRGATQIPGVSPVVAGVINVSGVIYTVLDLKHIFQLEADAGSGQYVIVIDHDKLKVCLLIDQVIDYRIISEKEIQTNLVGIKGKQKGYIQGLLKDSTVLLDVQNILSAQQSLFNHSK